MACRRDQGVIRRDITSVPTTRTRPAVGAKLSGQKPARSATLREAKLEYRVRALEERPSAAAIWHGRPWQKRSLDPLATRIMPKNRARSRRVFSMQLARCQQLDARNRVVVGCGNGALQCRRLRESTLGLHPPSAAISGLRHTAARKPRSEGAQICYELCLGAQGRHSTLLDGVEFARQISLSRECETPNSSSVPPNKVAASGRKESNNLETKQRLIRAGTQLLFR